MSTQSSVGIESNRIAPPVPVIAFARLDSSVALSDLQADTASLVRQTWINHVNRRDYQGGWDVLPLRCQRQHAGAHPILQGFSIAVGDDWQDLPVLQECPAIGELLAGLHVPVKSVRLMRLHAGGVIKPHRDLDLSIENGEARLHLPIHCDKDVLFKVDRQPVPMRAGELWYINADREHEVCNNGRSDRINLVIDCQAGERLHRRIHAASMLSYCTPEESKL